MSYRVIFKRYCISKTLNFEESKQTKNKKKKNTKNNNKKNKQTNKQLDCICFLNKLTSEIIQIAVEHNIMNETRKRWKK